MKNFKRKKVMRIPIIVTRTLDEPTDISNEIVGRTNRYKQ